MNDFKQSLDEIKKQRIKIYSIITFDLSIVRSNEPFQMTGSYVYVLASTGTATIRFNELTDDPIDLLKFRAISIPFYRFFITNIAQSGVSITLAIGVITETFKIDDSGASILGGVLTEATSPTLYNPICTNANTEYSQSLEECRKFTIKPRGGPLKVCFTSGGSGTTYILLNDGQPYGEDMIHPTALTLYFQSTVAGTVVEIIKWL